MFTVGKLLCHLMAWSEVLALPLKLAKNLKKAKICKRRKGTTMPPKGNSMTVPSKERGKLKRKVSEGEPGQAAGASVSCSSFWVCSQYLTLVDWMTESDKTDGIHDCIQLHWARLYTRPYKLWSNSNAHHDYFERLQLVFVVECSRVRLNFGQLYRKKSGLLLSSHN